MKSRYCFTPAAGKIRGNPPTLKERIVKRLKRPEKPDLMRIVDYYPAVYPTKK